jgi:hypothetical protein
MPLLPPLFFPLDEELGLGGGAWSPAVEQAVIRLGTWVPFERVPGELAALVRVTLGRETVRRRTEAAGAALVAAEQAAVEQLGRTWPAPEPVAAAWYQVSVDGAMVPLVQGQWAEVKTLAVGLLERQPRADGTGPVRATALSYFSRLADADAFRRQAWVETHRRGLTLAPRVCAVVDGAEWCQHFLDWHCPGAVRILDFPHAAEYVSAAARSGFGTEHPALGPWLAEQLHELKHGEPDAVLAALRALPAVRVAGPDGPHCPRDEALQYLTKRRAQIAYAAFGAAGLPIGSGVVESANKLVVEARLKGSGMHWARANVNPMLALRSALCSTRWDAAWAVICAEQQRQTATRRAQRCGTHRAAAAPPTPPAPVEPPAERQRRQVARLSLGHHHKSRPAPDHPWRKPFLRRCSAEPTPART